MEKMTTMNVTWGKPGRIYKLELMGKGTITVDDLINLEFITKIHAEKDIPMKGVYVLSDKGILVWEQLPDLELWETKLTLGKGKNALLEFDDAFEKRLGVDINSFKASDLTLRTKNGEGTIYRNARARLRYENNEDVYYEELVTSDRNNQ